MALDQAFQHGPTSNISSVVQEKSFLDVWASVNNRGREMNALGDNFVYQNCYQWKSSGAFENAPYIYCRRYACRYFNGHPSYITWPTGPFGHKLYPPNWAADKHSCPGPEESGCPTEWGYTYRQGKRRTWSKSTHDLIPPNKMIHSSKTGKISITCNSTGETIKAFCRPVWIPKEEYSGEQPYKIVNFEWVGGSPPECPGPGEAWAEWSSWSGNSTDT